MKHCAVFAILALAACGGTSPPAAQPSLAREPTEPTEAAATPPAVPALEAPPPAMSDDEFDEMMTTAVAMFEAMGKAVEDAGDDCGKAADGLAVVMDDNEAFMKTVRKLESDPAIKAKVDEWMKVHKEKMLAPMVKVATMGGTCANDTKFSAVLQRFEDTGR